MEEPAPTWADPPEGLLDAIFSRLPSFADRASCTGVCTNWRASAARQEHASPPLLPCLLRPSTAGISRCFHFFSKTSTDHPAVSEARFFGSVPGGWFVVARQQWRGYAVLNVSSGEEISLPDGSREDQILIPIDLRVGILPSALVILAATVSPAPTPDGHFVVAAITFGHHKAVVWQPGMNRWVPLEAEQGLVGPALGQRSQIMLEELEDVIYYSCDQHEGFYFLTSQEHLLVFDPEDDDGQLFGDLDGYLFPDHLMSSPPEAGQEVAGRYLVESEGRLLMVKRFIAPGKGTVSFQVFTLEWDSSDPHWVCSDADAVTGKLLFIGRGCSRAIRTGRSGPGFIYFLDDAEGFPDVMSIVRTDKQYRCSDAGWFRYSPQYIEKSWPQGPPPDCSPWIWLYH
nr:unnamed protein product [Digitaria exilis]